MRKVSISVSATRPVSHDAQRQPAQTCAPEGIGAVARLAVAPIPDLHEDTPRCAVSACPRGPAERAARARRHGDAPRFRPPSAFAGRHLASTLRLPARLRSSRPQDSAPAAGCGALAPRKEIGSVRLGCAHQFAASTHRSHLALDEPGECFQLNRAECLERCDGGIKV